ncbi:helix-turn-helix domain-containing protein [Mycolicibacterium nivoides]|uniref:Helix-turn-helix domain-containing protein n=1 Tax=Mycolicibacterium nivoides TaxID=2487344 RepID=A0ABW9LPE3_9MYCO
MSDVERDPVPAGGGDLARLASLVVERRMQLGMTTRQAFSDRVALTYRVLTDVENGNRRLGRTAYAEIERALGWAWGSIAAVLSGGMPTVLDQPPDLVDGLEGDAEIAAIATIVSVLDQHSAGERSRILRYINSRYADDEHGPGESSFGRTEEGARGR